MMPRTHLNWDRLKSRLAESRRRSEEIGRSEEDDLRRVFQERADRLARRRREAPASTRVVPVLVFCLGEEQYGLELAHVGLVLPMRQFTPVPGSSRELLGVANIRGELCSVLDLRALLELPASEEADAGYAVLIRDGADRFGLRVDRLDCVGVLDPEQLAVPDEERLPARYVRGVTPEGIIWLSVRDVTSHEVFSNRFRNPSR